ncbi:MAG: hypothetical protein ACRENE_06215 [Polyangiaceae bacterium]
MHGDIPHGASPVVAKTCRPAYLRAVQDEALRDDPAGEPLPSLAPPEGLTAARLREVAGKVRAARGTVDVSGVRGCAGAAAVAAIAREGKRVVLVTEDLDVARRAAQDLGFFVRGAGDEDAEDTGEGDVLVLA